MNLHVAVRAKTRKMIRTTPFFLMLIDVQYILDTVVEQLLLNKDRKFIYVEVAYFMRWWEEQTVERQEQVWL